MNIFPCPGPYARIIGFLCLTLAWGCAIEATKNIPVEIRLPPARIQVAPRRRGLVLVAADAVKERNLSRTETYVLREKTPLTPILLGAAAARMRAAGVEPLEAKEAPRSSGHLVLYLTRLEARLEGGIWSARAAVRAERYGRNGPLLGRWKGEGSGSHQDSRILAGASGLAMGKALARAMDALPWSDIATTGPK